MPQLSELAEKDAACDNNNETAKTDQELKAKVGCSKKKKETDKLAVGAVSEEKMEFKCIALFPTADHLFEHKLEPCCCVLLCKACKIDV